MSSSQESKTVYCKYCGGNKVIKFGSYRGIQRYFCTACGRKFKNDDHVFRMSVPVEYIEYVLNSYYGGMKINDIRNNIQLNYGYYPSTTLIRLWIDKYTDHANKMVQNHYPKVGSTWVLNELILILGRQRLWIYEIIDDKTKYLLASLISVHSKVVIKPLIQRASEITDIIPKVILVYMPPSRFGAMKRGAGYVFEHVPKETYADRHRIGISGNPKVYDTNIYRLKNPNGLRILQTATRFFNGLTLHYNYFAPNENTNGQTPAEAAQISYPCHSWKALLEHSSLYD